MSRRGALIALLVLAGCKGDDKPPAAAPPAAARDATAMASPGPQAGKQPDKSAPNQTDRKDAEALLAAWLAAQNQGDFSGYQKLYGDEFTGVRRSGKQVRRFDRAGWMEDRGRMFEKPMRVGTEAVSIMSHGAQTHAFLTQTFEQGTYKDAGRKWMALERGAAGLRIVREEMLDSTLIAKQEKALTAKAEPPAQPLANGAVALGWASKQDRIYLAPIVGDDSDLVIGRVKGAIGTGPIEVIEHTTDAASGSIAGVSARRQVDPKRLPAELASRIGKPLQLLDDKLAPLCRAVITEYSLEVVDWAPDGAESPEAAAAALLDDDPVVLAELELADGCPAGWAFAREVDLPALPRAAALDAATEKKISRAARAETKGADDVIVMGVAGDKSRAIVAATGHVEDSCETQEEYWVHLYLVTRNGDSWDVDQYGEYSHEDAMVAVVDADGDGVIDVFTERGSHHGLRKDDFWRSDIRVYWPPGLGCDGCEGDDCGD